MSRKKGASRQAAAGPLWWQACRLRPDTIPRPTRMPPQQIGYFSPIYSPLPAALSPSLMASASVMYLPFLVVP